MRRSPRFLGLALVLLLSSVSITSLGSHPARAALPVATPVGERLGRQQFGLVSAGSVVVWEDRLAIDTPAPLKPGDLADPTMGSSDIYGLDLATNRTLVIANGPDDQTAPAISGTLVVWEDSRASCPSCQLDIYGKDLVSNTEIAIATGPADQTRPAVFGRTVTWVESNESGIKLLGTDLEAPGVFEIASVPAGSSILRPAMSAELIVWAEISADAPATLHALDRATQAQSVLASLGSPPLEYAVDGRRVVWTDPQLRFTDLASGDTATLATERVSSPFIRGDQITWSIASTGIDTGLDVYGLNLRDGVATPLIVTPGSQQRAVVAQEELVWQNDTPVGMRLLSTPLSDALMTGPIQLADAQRQAAQQRAAADHQAGAVPLSHTTSFTRPTYKGIHTANGGGWNVLYNGIQQPCNATACPAVDALGAPNAPFFGSFLVIDYDLSKNTGRDTPLTGTNTKVADWMNYYQSTYSSRVTIRTWPTIYPKPSSQSGPKTPDDVAQQVISLATTYSWIKHVQINNEPNLAEGWPDNCQTVDCVWSSGGQTRIARWTDVYDDRKYIWINQFYVDAWFALDFYKGASSPLSATVKTRLSAMQFWTPPMSDIFQLVDGNIFYNYLQGMLDQYDRMTYHTYPAPNWDADGAGIKNNSWDWFNAWVQGRINASTLRTMITEFGWNPNQMADDLPWLQCVENGSFPPGGLTQNSVWPATGTWDPNPRCRAADSVSHTFESDLQYFLTNPNKLHKAEAVNVWIIKGWSNRADGITTTGSVLRWLHNYQWSSP